MDVRSLDYRENSERILRETPGVRDAVTGATLHFDRSRERGLADIDAEAWRRWAEVVKSHALTHLDACLVDAARKLRDNGAIVHWAASAADVLAVLEDIVSRQTVRRVVKGKSMLSEELGVNAHLEKLGVEVFETDLGEYILQLLDEPPSHILGPAIHRGLDEIRALFSERFGTPADASPDAIAAEARRVLREAFVTADLGITGGNFVVAETGTVALIENEGNIRLSTSLPRVHVALVGIEKILPRWTDLAPFLQLTARAATGQRIGTFVSLIQGPRSRPATKPRAPENDGPDEVHVVFVDNGRTRVLADDVAWEALRCVRCGACLNVCPVYRQTGGHAYGWVYSGPIGAILNPGLLGLGEAHPLPYASTLCGACFDVCPVRIPIPEILLEWRARAVDAGMQPASERRMMKTFASIATKPGAFRAAERTYRTVPGIARRTLPVLKDWESSRARLKPSKRSFLDLWKREPEPDGNAAASAARPDAAADATVQETTARAGESATRRAFAGGTLGPTATRSRAVAESGNAVLDAVRAAIADRTRVAHPGPLQASDSATSPRHNEPIDDDAARTSDDEARLDRFAQCAVANGMNVVRFNSLAEAGAWLAAFTREYESAAVGDLVPPALSPLRHGAAEAVPAYARLGVSMAIAGAAETGTALLDSRDGRATQLLPGSHLVWIRRADIHWTLGEALDAVRADLPAAIGLHSGPSRSADIGRVLVTGVHGPGHVVVAIIP